MLNLMPRIPNVEGVDIWWVGEADGDGSFHRTSSDIMGGDFGPW